MMNRPAICPPIPSNNPNASGQFFDVQIRIVVSVTKQKTIMENRNPSIGQ